MTWTNSGLVAAALALASVGAGCSKNGESQDALGIGRGTTHRAVPVKLRRTVAELEAKRSGGTRELVALWQRFVRDGAIDTEIEWLIFRALGRSGDAESVSFLLARLMESGGSMPLLRPAPNQLSTAAHAASALGLAAALESLDVAEVAKAGEAIAELVRQLRLPNVRAASSIREQRALIEALGRVNDQSLQQILASFVYDVDSEIAEAACIALGRNGRRGIELTLEASAALQAATFDQRLAVRFAAVWALSRQKLSATNPAAAQQSLAALRKATGDSAPTIQATALAGLARRAKLALPFVDAVEQLGHRDWRVAIEAIRAATAVDLTEPQRRTFAMAVSRLVQLSPMPTHTPTVVAAALEATLEQKPFSNAELAAIDLWLGSFEPRLQTLQRQLACLLAAHRAMDTLEDNSLDACLIHPAKVAAPFEVAVRVLNSSKSPVELRKQIAQRMWLAGHPVERAASLAAVPALLDEAVISAAIADSNSVVAGAAIEAVARVVKAETVGEHREVVDRVLKRATSETDPELASSLLGLLGELKLEAGKELCRRPASHPVIAKAAADCVAKLNAKSTDETAVSNAAAVTAKRNAPVSTFFSGGLQPQPMCWQVVTTGGSLSIDLDGEVAPWHVGVIAELTRKGFYDGLSFHRWVGNFVVQGGDPTATGWGGPGFLVPAEPSTSLDGPGFVEGAIGFADAGKDSGGSQWFAMHSYAPHLDGRYTNVGTIVVGDASSIAVGDRVSKASIEAGKCRH